MMPEITENFDKQSWDAFSLLMTTRLQQLDLWLSETIGTKDYQLAPASGDASFRRYFRLNCNDETFIVMDAPPQQENCVPFIDVTKRLLAIDINVPEIIAKDLEKGFLLLSDLGDKQYLDELTQENVGAMYSAAWQALIRIQQQADWKDLPSYGEKLLLQEMALFRNWLLQEHLGLNLAPATHSMLDEVFQLLASEALSQPRVFVHRDYHSRNLMMNNQNNSDPGVLDFQDAVYGPFTYDLVSLLKDCYIKWPRQQVRGWAKEFFMQIADDHPNVGEASFIRWFDLMGVQRHLKASGIFARLCHRDGKTGYLADIPRTLSYIIDLHDEYPELRGLIELIQNHILNSPLMTSTKGKNNSCAP